jgi:hypothetical protein
MPSITRRVTDGEQRVAGGDGVHRRDELLGPGPLGAREIVVVGDQHPRHGRWPP